MKTIYTLLFTFFTFFIATAQIVITEISYNPPEGGQDSLEYIEIYNAGAADYDLTGATLVGVEYTFENEILQAGTYLCISVNAAAMENVFGINCLQWTAGGLRNGGEVVAINDANGTELDAVEYGTAAPWPSSSEGTNGNGASIVLCDVTSDNSDAANWSAAKNNIGYQIDGKEVKGSPGADNAPSCEIIPDFTIEAFPDNTFAPNDITINPGQTVRFVNTGGFHNVDGDKATFPDNPESFGNGAASAMLWTYDFTFFNEGVYQYQCTPHATLGMNGTITVGVPKTFPVYSIGTINTENSEGIADSVGTTCEISGTVHGINISNSNGLLFWVIDEDHEGISVYHPNSDLGYTVSQGDQISIRGEVSQFRGLTQFNAETIVSGGSGTIQTPITIDSLEEQYESKLVRLDNMTFVDASQWRGDGSSFNVNVTNGTYTATMRISEFTDLANQSAPTPPFNLVGLVNQFDNTEPYLEFYQLMPRDAGDIMMISSVDDNELSQVEIYPNPTDGRINISGINQPDEVCIYGINGQLLHVWNSPGNTIMTENNSGMYILSIRQDDKIEYRKLMINK